MSLRTLTEEDIEAIRQATATVHICWATPEMQLDFKRYRKGINALATAIGWGVILLMGSAVVYLIALGAKIKGL